MLQTMRSCIGYVTVEHRTECASCPLTWSTATATSSCTDAIHGRLHGPNTGHRCLCMEFMHYRPIFEVSMIFKCLSMNTCQKKASKIGT